ncbi:hypothetical protein R0381_001713 [Jeongeupia wiesaeckerbachi]|uniref:hypothetical protein n=1 Tax=Jeongeupia wiesaeckerbachi TaxID=3051218 RepID=UPI003D806853
MKQWLNKLLRRGFSAAAASSRFPATELMPSQRRASEAGSHPLKHSLTYRIKRDALMIVAEMNRGATMENCELLARQLAFVQKELIQAAYHDDSLPKEQRVALAKYHALNIRQGLGERRTQPMRGIVVPQGER